MQFDQFDGSYFSSRKEHPSLNARGDSFDWSLFMDTQLVSWESCLSSWILTDR